MARPAAKAAFNSAAGFSSQRSAPMLAPSLAFPIVGASG